MPLLYLGRGPLGPGKSVHEGARSTMNQLLIRLAEFGLFHPLVGSHALNGQFDRRQNNHLFPGNTAQNVACHTEHIVVGAAPSY